MAQSGSRSLTFLEKISNVCIIVVAVVIVFVVIQNYTRISSGSRNEPSRLAETAQQLTGKTLHISDISAAQFSTESVVLLIISTRCRFCSQSMPFYRRLVEARQKPSARFSLAVAVAFPEDKAAATDYLKENGINADVVFSVRLTDLGVIGTPTILALDKRGTIRHVWTGLLDSARERELLAKLN